MPKRSWILGRRCRRRHIRKSLDITLRIVGSVRVAALQLPLLCPSAYACGTSNPAARRVCAAGELIDARPRPTWQILSREMPVLPQASRTADGIGPSRGVGRSPVKIRLAVVKAEPGTEIRVRPFAPSEGSVGRG